MGAVHGNILVHIETEFQRVQEEAASSRRNDSLESDAGDAGDVPSYKTRSLSYDQLKQMQCMIDLQLDWHHVPTLFAIDIDRDGRFSMEELKSFAFWAAQKIGKHVSTDAFQGELQARCSLQMWTVCHEQEDSAGVFTKWLGLLLSECRTLHYRHVNIANPCRLVADGKAPGAVAKAPSGLTKVAYVNSDVGVTLYLLLVQNQGVTFQEFWNLLQVSGGCAALWRLVLCPLVL